MDKNYDAIERLEGWDGTQALVARLADDRALVITSKGVELYNDADAAMLGTEPLAQLLSCGSDIADIAV